MTPAPGGWLRTAAATQPHADLAVAAVVFAATLLTTAVGPAGVTVDPGAAATAALACGVLALRRRAPATTVVVSAVAAEGYLMHFGNRHGSTVLAAPLIALYTIAEASRQRRSVIIGTLTVLAFAGVHALVKQTTWLGADTIALSALGGLAVAAGTAARHRHAYLIEVEARARQAEAERDAEAARLVAEERLRIARDLHDVVGHQLALIHVQARVAAHVLDAEPERARRSMAHVTAASRSALDALSSTVGLLRGPGEARPPTEPVTGLAGLPELLAGFRGSGLLVTERIDGDPGPLPAPVDLAAYRIVQESLTNVCKHVGPTSVTVDIAFRRQALHVAVDNAPRRPGAGQPHPPAARPPDRTPGGTGHGLVGMRERVGALGGSIQAGPRPDGGYRVTAVLPTGARPAGGRP